MFSAVARKGNKLIFLYQDEDLSGNAYEVGDVCRSPGLSYLFSLTAFGCLTVPLPLVTEVDVSPRNQIVWRIGEKAGKEVQSLCFPVSYDRPLKIQRSE